MTVDYHDFQTISIDFEVFKGLTALRESPTDDYNAVLRRLLQLPAPTGERASNAVPDGRAWEVGGTSFPHGTALRATYKGRVYEAHVQNGELELNGETFNSPSAAGMAITDYAVNGWRFWECQVPGRGWVSLDAMRRR